MNYLTVTKSYLNNTARHVTDMLSQSAILKNNINLKGIHKGQRCFILGSGSSIKSYDLKKLENEFVITQNNFHNHEDIKIIKPNLHCVVPFYQTPDEYGAWGNWLQEMRSNLPKDILYLFGKNTKTIVDKQFSDSKNIFYFSSKYRVLTLTSPKMDITKNIMEIPTVLTLCLIAALYLGFSEIVLIGFDFDQIISNRSDNFNRFYGKSKITNTKSEFNSELKYVGSAYESAWYHRWLTIKQLNLIKHYSEGNGARIVNGSEEGILEVFDRQFVGKNFENI